jgi:hypothetical protein
VMSTRLTTTAMIRAWAVMDNTLGSYKRSCHRLPKV